MSQPANTPAKNAPARAVCSGLSRMAATACCAPVEADSGAACLAESPIPEIFSETVPFVSSTFSFARALTSVFAASA